MHKLSVFVGLFFLTGCHPGNTPDVSGIRVDAAIARFDKDFFAADSTRLVPALDAVQAKYPWFFTDFVRNIVIGGNTDTLKNVPLIIESYITHSRPLYDSVLLRFSNLDNVSRQLQTGFRYVKYYFPAYNLPRPVAYSGLIGDPSIALMPQAMAIGLQMYLGANFSAYNTPEAIDKFPQYISRRFAPEYISVNCLQNIALDIYPEKPPGQSLIEQIIEKGKQWWLAGKFLPGVADTLQTGYTAKQLEWCNKNEGLIWNFIIQNNDVFTTEPTTIQTFIGESPKTDGMPDQSPGNIGQWVGWQIVQKFAKDHDNLSVSQVLQTPARKLFDEAKYKPR
jgi:hypothetical protein